MHPNLTRKKAITNEKSEMWQNCLFFRIWGSYSFFSVHGVENVAWIFLFIALWKKLWIWKMCLFYTFCLSKTQDSLLIGSYKISTSVTSFSACSQWLTWRRISFHKQYTKIFWLIYYYGSSHCNFFKELCLWHIFSIYECILCDIYVLILTWTTNCFKNYN